MNISRLRPLVILFAILMFGATALGQTSQPDSTAQPQPTRAPSLEKKFLANILRDQRAIWTSPFSLHRGDAKWLAPLGIATAVFVATDRHTSSELFVGVNHRKRINISGNFSRLGTGYATGGVAVAFYFIGRAKNDARARETGVLSAQALIDSAIVDISLKTVSQRQRPTMDHTSGKFFDGGSSFPSGHAMSAWSVATVVASEYGRRRPLVRFGAYGIATVVSVARYTGTNHFLSDVLVGSALGYGIGRYVYHHYHDPSLDGATRTLRKKSIIQSKLFPRIAPTYSRRGHIYGAKFAWSL
jgi:membrane-associated phospholipid phosphatase